MSVEHVTAAIAILQRELQNPEGLLSQFSLLLSVSILVLTILQRELQNPEGLLSRFSLLLSVPILVLTIPLSLARLASNESVHKVSTVYRSPVYFTFGRLACR